jgi:coenzyme F420 hydrogenase subunit beta
VTRLQTVIEGRLCSGCGLCAAVLGADRARMTMQGDGYLRPQITGPVTMQEDDLIGQACPGTTVNLRPGEASGVTQEWGPLLSVATGHATDDALRRQASSGGALSAVLKHLLQTGSAAYVLQVAASADTPWLNQVIRSVDADGVTRASGSRYAPSAPLEPILQCLAEGRPFIFVGKPCDVSALRAYARHDPRVDRLVVAMIAFMCGGVPSAAGVELLIRKMGADPRDVRAFRFRGNGWPGRATAVTASGEEFGMSYDESWGNVLRNHIQLRCRLCADGGGISADIVCADGWYSDDAGAPVFDERDGRSLVLARTAKGAAVIEGAVRAGHLATSPLGRDQIERMQPSQLDRMRLVWSRLLAMRMFGMATPDYGPALRQYGLNLGLARNIRSFLGTARRIVLGRL